MNAKHIVAPSWCTKAIGDVAGPSPLEFAELGDYVDLCKVKRGRVFAFYCFAESVVGFVAGRLVTTLLLAVLLIAVGSLVL